MSRRLSPTSSVIAAALALYGVAACGEQGIDRAVDGGTDTITSPARIFDGIKQETNAHGPVGVVTGSLKGGAAAADQAVRGAADIGVGVFEAITSPLRR
jgi:hypothetical protein